MNAPDSIFTKKSIEISYPGISCEATGNGFNIYEPNFNCGSVSAMLLGIDSITDQNNKQLILNVLIQFFEHIKEKNSSIIFITDETLLYSTTLHNILKTIFGADKYKIVGTKMGAGYKDDFNGSPVRDSTFSDETTLIQEIKNNPDTLVLSSIPYSDPRINHLLEQLTGLESTKSYKSMRLIQLNGDRENHVAVAGESIGNLGIARQKGDIIDFSKDVKSIVVKTISGSAGGTGVNFLNSKEQIEKFDREAKMYPYLVNSFIEPETLELEGKRFPFHIRPFFDSNGFYLGCALKISEIGMTIKTGTGKSAFNETNKGLNTSAGNSKTIFINSAGTPVMGFIDKNSEPLDNIQVSNYLKQFTYKQKPLTPDTISNIAIIYGGVVRDIQLKTNGLLGFNNN